MVATLIGFVFGALMGATTGSVVGICAGAAGGALIGVFVDALRWLRSLAGDAPTTERHLAMCAVYGQTAECEFVGDLHTRRWSDVRSCSLLATPTRVECEKTCVSLIGLAGVRPGGACSCRKR